MPLADVQRAAAALYTLPAARARLREHPQEFASKLKLTPQELAAFQTIDPARLDSYARSLVRKRVAESRRLLPFTARVLGRRFAGAFEAYALKHPLPDHPRYANDALAFTRFLLDEGLEGPREALVRFESANLAMRLAPGFRIESFGFPIRQLLADPEGTCRRGWSFAVWFRPARPASVVRFIG
jgi:hypothetical protein